MNDKNRSFIFKLKTVPGSGIWTGGVGKDGKVGFSGLKATSFLGGLRFWTAALLRSLGRKVCEANVCETEKEGSCCDLCRIFGCTGSARTFLMQLKHLDMEKAAETSKVSINRMNKDGEKAKYYFKNGYQNEFSIKLVPNIPGKEIPDEIPVALALMIKYGTLGVQDQYGCGLVNIVDSSLEENNYPKLKSVKSENSKMQGFCPDLRDFFFFRVSLDMPSNPSLYNLREVMAYIRHDTRDALRPGAKNSLVNTMDEEAAKELRHEFCGFMPTSSGDKGQSRGTMYALAVDQSTNILYGWGWYPNTAEYKDKRKIVLRALTDSIEKNNDVRIKGKSVWLDFYVPEQKKTWNDYLQYLLTLTWRQ